MKNFFSKNYYKNLKRKKFSNKNKVLEIVSNDISFLKYLHRKFKCFFLGVNPVKNIFKYFIKQRGFLIKFG